MHVSSQVKYLDYSTRQYQSKTDRRTDPNKDPVPVRKVDEQTDSERRKKAAQQQPAPVTARRDDTRDAAAVASAQVTLAPRTATITTLVPTTATVNTATLWAMIGAVQADGMSSTPTAAVPAVAAPAPSQPEASLQDLLARVIA